MTETDFSGRAVFVTGAASGIGRALCAAFARAGAQVALCDIDGARAAQAADAINAGVARAAVTPYAFDVADVAALRDAVDAFASSVGRLDVAVANAGLTNYGAFLDYTPEAFDRVLEVNLRGSYFTAQAAARQMIRFGHGGRVLLLSSITGLQAFPNLSAYGVSKAGIAMMARSLGPELGAHGITVNALAPGATLTERTLGDDPDFERNWAAVTPTGAAVQVQDIAHAALFLASDAARHITGVTLSVDGGWTATSPIPGGHPALPEVSSQLR